jgi:very-short-patch-repair endonuclease
MNLVRVVRDNDGIMHRSDLYRVGATKAAVRSALQHGWLHRVRRDWVAIPTCPPGPLRAIRIGARLSCVSAAQHLGLWVIDDHRFHVAATPSSSRLHLKPEATELSRPTVVHWSKSTVPVTARTIIDPIENVLVQVAHCQPFEHAVAVVDSSLNKRLVRRNQLLRLAARVGGKFAAVVAESDGRADSGLESLPRVRLARRGVSLIPQVSIDGHRVDGLIGERLVLQFDGDAFHSEAADRERDRREDARLVLQGFSVLRYGTAEVMEHWPDAENEILSVIAQGLHLWPETISESGFGVDLRPRPQEIVRFAGRQPCA